MTALPPVERLQVDALLDDPTLRTVVCCGSGGVGKTTTAAALGLRAAERGRHAVVLTIDPARRLAQALGLRELDNTPRRVDGIDTAAGGTLDAMMLDMKRTFDDVVLTHAPRERAEQILANPFYQALSSSFAGTQEYMAMERLGQLREQDGENGRYDLIVVDTPPSRSALDFLDAPERLSSFLDGRLIRLLAPARGPFRLVSVGMGVVGGVLTKILGTQLLRELQTFVAALDSTFGGFRERAERTYRLLQEKETAFLVVAAPETDALREASYFVQRLREDDMPLAGLVLNRATEVLVPNLSAERSLGAAEALENTAVPPPDGGTPPRDDADDDARVAAALLRLHAERMRLATRERLLTDRFRISHPGVPIGRITALPADVNDLPALREVAARLAG